VLVCSAPDFGLEDGRRGTWACSLAHYVALSAGAIDSVFNIESRRVGQLPVSQGARATYRFHVLCGQDVCASCCAAALAANPACPSGLTLLQTAGGRASSCLLSAGWPLCFDGLICNAVVSVARNILCLWNAVVSVAFNIGCLNSTL
jgi:hypothetical protein